MYGCQILSKVRIFLNKFPNIVRSLRSNMVSTDSLSIFQMVGINKQIMKKKESENDAKITILNFSSTNFDPTNIAFNVC